MKNHTVPAFENCRGCSAQPGENHGEGCDHAVCPECGTQLTQCYEHDSGRPAIWHGIDPAAEVAQKLGWWTTAAGIDHLVVDYTRVLIANALGMATWDRYAQRYAIGQIDEERLNRAVANS